MPVAERYPMSRIGVVSALKDEADRFSRHLRIYAARHNGALETEIVRTGLGEERVIKALENAFQAPPDALIVFGTAAGIDPSLKPGDLVAYTTVNTFKHSQVSTSKALNDYLLAVLTPLNPQHGKGLSVVEAVCSVEEKRQLYDSESCLCVDMESAAIARWAVQHKVPFACLRAIVDGADRAVPSAALAGLRPDGTTDALATCIALLKNPGQFAGLVRLARDYNTAMNKLSVAARLIVSDLYDGNPKEFERSRAQH